MATPKIECVRLRDIYDFACTAAESWKPGDVASMSKTRALAWRRNPHGDPEDVVLLVARMDGRCVGYLGLLPGLARVGAEFEKVYWASTFYVPPEERESATGALLVMRAIALNYNLAVVGPSEEAARIYRAAGFRQLRPLRYLRCDLSRLNFVGLPFRAARKVLRSFDMEVAGVEKGIALGRRLTRRLAYSALGARLPNGWAADRIRWVSVLDDRTFEGDADAGCPVRFYRDSDLINWMLSSPWVTTNRAEMTPGYYFTDFRDHFEYQLCEFPGGGFAILSLVGRDGEREVRVLDYHIREPKDESGLANLAFECARAFGADSIVLPSFCEFEVAAAARPLCKAIERNCFVRPRPRGSNLATVLDRICLHYCDGDIAFA